MCWVGYPSQTAGKEKGWRHEDAHSHGWGGLQNDLEGVAACELPALALAPSEGLDSLGSCLRQAGCMPADLGYRTMAKMATLGQPRIL